MASADKPRVACEISPERVIAARVADSGSALDVFAARTVPAGALLPTLGTGSVVNAGALRDSVSDALATVGARSREIIALVPDVAVRIVLLDFEELPDRRDDADAVVRFRLKKSLPFDADHASLSYDVHRGNGAVKVVAAVSPPGVVEEYESVIRDAGYSPGVVLPSMLAALGGVEAAQPTLVVKIDTGSTSVAIVKNNDLLLYRTLESTRTGLPEAASLADEIYPSLVFFQDHYGMKVERILLAGVASARDLGAALETHTGAKVEDLVSSAQAGQSGNLPSSLLAGVLGALIG
ncbi:MAG: type IV pilus biogenesis protein PilM [Terriglobales bacterium]